MCLYLVLYSLTLAVDIRAAVMSWSSVRSGWGNRIAELCILYGGVVGHFYLLLSSLAQLLQPRRTLHHPYTGVVLAGYSCLALVGDVCITAESSLSVVWLILNVCITLIQQGFNFRERAGRLRVRDICIGAWAVTFAALSLAFCILSSSVEEAQIFLILMALLLWCLFVVVVLHKNLAQLDNAWTLLFVFFFPCHLPMALYLGERTERILSSWTTWTCVLFTCISMLTVFIPWLIVYVLPDACRRRLCEWLRHVQEEVPVENTTT